MTANISETVHGRRDKIAPQCVEHREAFVKQIKQLEGWEGFAKVLSDYDEELTNVIKEVVESFSKDPLANPEGLDFFLHRLEVNTLYWSATKRDRQIGNDSHQAFDLATAIVQYHCKESREAEKPVDIGHLKKLTDDDLDVLPQNTNTTALGSRGVTDDTDGPSPPTDGSSLYPSQSSLSGITAAFSWVSDIFTGSKQLV